MLELAIHLKLMHIYSHAAHNSISGPTFLSDHDFFGELYEKREEEYDAVVERYIGLYNTINFKQIETEALNKFHSMQLDFKSGVNYFQQQLMLEKQLCDIIEQYATSGKYSQGTIQMIGNIADQSEMYQYKIKQRIKR